MDACRQRRTLASHEKINRFRIFLALAPFSWAQLISFSAHLTGDQENPPNASMGEGWANATLDTSNNWFTFHEEWVGLSAGATASHIHGPAPAGMNAPVLIPFVLATHDTDGEADFLGFLTDLQVDQLMGGLFYVNVHTANYPAGEIRGQLLATPVPEPSAYALVGMAMLGLLVVRRKFSTRKMS